jgi:AcrR family transcriptional regulator
VPRLSDADRSARRQAVIEGARRAFSRWGYAGATVRRLEEEIGLSRGGIFNWFPDKWALFLAVSDDDQRLAMAEADAAGDLIEAATLVGRTPLAGHLGAYLEALVMLRDDPAKHADWLARNERWAPELQRRWADLARRGGVRDDVALEDLAEFAIVVGDGLALHRAMGQEYPAEQLAVFVRLLRDGIGATPQPSVEGPGGQPSA